MAESTEKRIVVVTKESMFYVPEGGSPIQARSVPKINSSLSSSFLDTGSPSKEGAPSPVTKPSLRNYRAVCLAGVGVLLLVVLGLLLASLGRDPAPLHTVTAAALGGSLGYTIAHAQRMLS